MKKIRFPKREFYQKSKVGIFGYTGVGKTTYLACLYYQLQQDAYSDAEDGEATNKTISYFKRIIDRIEGVLNKENRTRLFEAANSGELVSATKSDPIDLQFALSLKNRANYFKHFKVHLQDYMGEVTSIDQMRNNLGAFFLQCDSLIIFLSTELIDKDELTFKPERYGEIKSLIALLEDEQYNLKFNIPVCILITKVDQIKSEIDRHIAINGVEEYVNEAFEKVIEKVKGKANAGFEVFTVSSIESFIWTHRRDFNDQVHEVPHRNLLMPLKWCIQSGQKNKNSKKRNKLLKYVSGVVGGLTLIVILFLWYVKNEYIKIKEFVDSGGVSSREAAQAWEEFNERYYSDFVYMPRVSKEDIEKNIQILIDKDENETYNKVVRSSKTENFPTTIRYADQYKVTFPRGKNLRAVDSIREQALFSYVMASREQSMQPEEIIRRCDKYLEQSDKKLYVEAVLKVKSEAQRIIDLRSAKSNDKDKDCSAIYLFGGSPKLIKFMRNYRDKVLSKSKIGKRFIHIYYHVISPFILKHIKK